MQNILGSLLPIFVFFGCYKFYDLYVATGALLLVTIVAAAFTYWRSRKVDILQLASAGLVVLMAAATLMFREPWFIKLKPTVIYWLFAASFVVCRRWLHCPTMVDLMLRQLPQIALPAKAIWQLNCLWGLSFGLLGAVNLAVARWCSTDCWVNFKLFGSLGWLIITSLLQGMVIYRSGLDGGSDSTDVDADDGDLQNSSKIKQRRN